MTASNQARQSTRKPYRSSVREERALDTKRRIAEAAQNLFAEHGFAGTTVANIAARAGVAVPTVYATFGSKGAIVQALLAKMETDAGSVEWVRRIAQERDPHAKLGSFVQWTTTLFASTKAIIQAARGASADPASNELREEGDRHRRNGLRTVIGQLIQDNTLSSGLSAERALDRAWMLTGVELYLSATDSCGWTDSEYERWLTALLQQQLLSH